MRTIQSFGVGIGFGLLFGTGFCLAGGTTIEINEIDAIAEFVELYDGGGGSTSLDGLVLVLYENATDSSYSAFDLDGFSTDGDGFFVVGEVTVPNVDLVIGGPDVVAFSGGVALYTDDATSFPNGTPVTLTGLVDAITYGNRVFSDAGLNPLLVSGLERPVAAHHGSGAALGRCPDGGGAARDTTRWTARPATPGAPSTCLSDASFCTGLDGGTAHCPCGAGFIDAGCDRPIGAMQGGGLVGGLRLNFIAMETSPLNRATITGTGIPFTSVGTSVLFRSSSKEPVPIVFGDGLRCTSTQGFVRLGGAAGIGGIVYHSLGHGAMAGSGTFYYQTWNRNHRVSFCNPAAAFTTGSGLMITW